MLCYPLFVPHTARVKFTIQNSNGGYHAHGANHRHNSCTRRNGLMADSRLSLYSCAITRHRYTVYSALGTYTRCDLEQYYNFELTVPFPHMIQRRCSDQNVQVTRSILLALCKSRTMVEKVFWILYRSQNLIDSLKYTRCLIPNRTNLVDLNRIERSSFHILFSSSQTNSNAFWMWKTTITRAHNHCGYFPTLEVDKPLLNLPFANSSKQ